MVKQSSATQVESISEWLRSDLMSGTEISLQAT